MSEPRRLGRGGSSGARVARVCRALPRSWLRASCRFGGFGVHACPFVVGPWIQDRRGVSWSCPFELRWLILDRFCQNVISRAGARRDRASPRGGGLHQLGLVYTLWSAGARESLRRPPARRRRVADGSTAWCFTHHSFSSRRVRGPGAPAQQFQFENSEGLPPSWQPPMMMIKKNAFRPERAICSPRGPHFPALLRVATGPRPPRPSSPLPRPMMPPEPPRRPE